MNFLNSYAFEQMAREYNARYGTAYALNKKDDKIVLKVKQDFETICRLFCMLKNSFKNNKSTRKLFDDFDKWIKRADDLFDSNFCSINTSKQIKHKECAILFIELLNNFIYYIDNIEVAKELEKDLLKVGFCEKSKDLYISFFEIIKNFYMNI